MNLVLTDFMQTVSLRDPTSPKNFLVFTNEEGEELRVPVGADAIETLTRFAFGRKQFPEETDSRVDLPSEPVSEVPSGTPPSDPEFDDEDLDEDDPDATTFGGDVEEGDDDPDPVRPLELPRVPSDTPRSEAEVKSL